MPAAAPSPDGLAIRFMAYPGLRIGEFSALRAENLDLDDLRVRVFEEYTDVKGKLVLGLPEGDKKRTLDLVPDLVDELRAHMKGKAADALVFRCRRRADPANQVEQAGVAPGGQAGRAVHRRRRRNRTHRARLAPHLRKLCASAGISSRYIAEWMGHASTAITESVYIDLFPKDLDAHAALLGAAMSNGSE